jgi:8-oxo-dGTP pyrophosphatase MutT (NUDIX family)
MPNRRYASVVDVHLILIESGKILLGLRQNTGFADGMFHLPAGHLEPKENIADALIREAQEELGIRLDGKSLRLGLVIHQGVGEGRIGFFFVADKWSGAVRNNEPHKCSHLEWFEPACLPETLVPYAREALDAFFSGQNLVLYGWDAFTFSRSQVALVH